MKSVLSAARPLLYLVWALGCLWFFQQLNFATLVLDPVQAELKGDQCPQFASTCSVPARLEGTFSPFDKTLQVTTKADGRTFFVPERTLSFSIDAGQLSKDEGHTGILLVAGLAVTLLGGLWIIRRLTRR